VRMSLFLVLVLEASMSVNTENGWWKTIKSCQWTVRRDPGEAAAGMDFGGV
jgi:hypothetical protein